MDWRRYQSSWSDWDICNSHKYHRLLLMIVVVCGYSAPCTASCDVLCVSTMADITFLQIWPLHQFILVDKVSVTAENWLINKKHSHSQDCRKAVLTMTMLFEYYIFIVIFFLCFLLQCNEVPLFFRCSFFMPQPTINACRSVYPQTIYTESLLYCSLEYKMQIVHHNILSLNPARDLSCISLSLPLLSNKGAKHKT